MSYRCPVCGDPDENDYRRGNRPECSDGRDPLGRERGPAQKLTEADLKDAVIVQCHGTEALPRGMCVVVQHKEGTSAVIWFGPANMIPDHGWEPGTTINV